MAEAVKEVAKTEPRKTPSTEFRPFANLRREIDHLFDDFEWGSWRLPMRRALFDLEPSWRDEITWSKVPAVDIVDTEKSFEVTAELPGLDEKQVEVKFSNGILTIHGEKKEEREEKKQNYQLSERRYGSFQRSFTVPDGIDADKIEAKFKDGVLTVSLPKTPAAQRKETQITIKKG